MSGRDTNNPREFSVCMGMDAFRLCLGIKPRWLRLVSKVAA